MFNPNWSTLAPCARPATTGAPRRGVRADRGNDPAVHRDDARNPARSLGACRRGRAQGASLGELQTLAAELEELTRAVERSSPMHVEPGEYRAPPPKLSDEPSCSSGSIFPPDSTTTVLRDNLDLAVEDGCQRHGAARLDHQPMLAPCEADRRLRSSASLTATPRAPRRFSMPKVSATLAASGSHRIASVEDWARPARSLPARATGACRPSLPARRRRSRHRGRPARSPKPGRRRRNGSRFRAGAAARFGQLLEISSPTVPCPATIIGSS